MGEAAKKIEGKIVGYRVAKNEPAPVALAPAAPAKPDIAVMNEALGRPELLVGNTYKIKPPVSEHALYITINDVVLNEGTEHEQRHPYEVFINSKSMEHFQWVTALTLVISACFRKGGDLAFLIDELTSVYAPDGGYFKKGGKFMPSLVAEIGDTIKKHMLSIGLIEVEGLDPETQKHLAEKRAAFEAQTAAQDKVTKSESSDYPANATMCGKCNTKAVIIMDGCATCLACADSKCG